MIEKLRKRIFYLIFISISIIVLGVIILFAIFNYHNTINIARRMVNRMSQIDLIKDEPVKPPRDEPIMEDQRKIDDVYYSTVDEAIDHANSILIVSAVLCVLSLIIIYIGAKKISKIIVKPVEETFEKQKQFISDASHELKTPLAVIEANADVLENELQDNKWIKYIQNETDSMNKLINELLMLAKIENIDTIRELKQINLSKELEIIISMFESMAYEKKIKIDSNIKEDIMLKASKEDIEHIVSTLLDNAIKHTESNQQVIVELDKEKNDIIIQVKNYGDPIPEEEREKIFERFYRIDKSRNRKEKRYGLGLAIAKSTVEKYKGKIEVSYKDHFTIFKVYIPV